MAFDADADFDTAATFDPPINYALRVQTDSYSVPSAEAGATMCIPQPMCGCLIPPNEPPYDPEACDTDFPAGNPGSGCIVANLSLDCDLPCVDVEFIQLLIEIYSIHCPSIPDDSPLGLFCDRMNGVTEDDGTNIGFTTPSVCCFLRCWEEFVDRKLEGCIDLAYLQEQGFFGEGEGQDYDECLAAWEFLTKLWCLYQTEFILYNCFGIPFALLPGQVNLTNPAYAKGINGPIVTYQSIQLPPGSRLISSECNDFSIGTTCECPTLLS